MEYFIHTTIQLEIMSAYISYSHIADHFHMRGQSFEISKSFNGRCLANNINRIGDGHASANHQIIVSHQMRPQFNHIVHIDIHQHVGVTSINAYK